MPPPHQGGPPASHEHVRVQDLFANPARRQDLALPFPHGGQELHYLSLVQPQPEGAWLLCHFRHRFSGTGRIAKVMVSADGGKSWGEAALQGTVHEKAFTRFVMPWRWDGQPAILQSRAWDEAGNVQPLRAEFVAARGEARNPVT